MKTSDLIGSILDWAVAKCEGIVVVRLHDLMREVAEKNKFAGNLEWHLSVRKDEFWMPNGEGIGGKSFDSYSPSTDWAQGGPIIERERILIQPEIGKEGCGNAWSAIALEGFECFGPTPLIAAMRCYVASKLGDEVEIPDELS